MIEIFHLTKTYGDQTAVSELSLKIEAGELFALLGPNGAGKSSVVKIMTGLIKPTSGIVRIAGFDVTENPIEIKKRIGYVPENASLYESLTADEYLSLVADLRHLTSSTYAKRKEELFAVFQIEAVDRTKLLSEFSKGMKQKILLISALMHNPEILILDEPLSGLDANTALIVKEVLRRFRENGKTIFFSSHVMDVVEKIATRVGVIAQGQLVALGTPSELLELSAQPSLELAFNVLTNGGNVDERTSSILRSLSDD